MGCVIASWIPGQYHAETLLGGKAHDNSGDSGGRKQTDAHRPDLVERHQADGYDHDYDQSGDHPLENLHFRQAPAYLHILVGLRIELFLQHVKQYARQLDQNPSDRNDHENLDRMIHCAEISGVVKHGLTEYPEHDPDQQQQERHTKHVDDEIVEQTLGSAGPPGQLARNIAVQYDDRRDRDRENQKADDDPSRLVLCVDVHGIHIIIVLMSAPASRSETEILARKRRRLSPANIVQKPPRAPDERVP